MKYWFEQSEYELKSGIVYDEDKLEKELSKFTHLQDVGVISLDDAERLKVQIEEMKKSLVSLEEQLKIAISEKKAASDFYTAYENQMKSDYQILFEQAKAELENLRRD